MNCNHYSVGRHINEDNTPADKWTCNVCGASFYHLENIKQGPLTLRDQFAMAALHGRLAAGFFPSSAIALSVGKEMYNVADAMMEARNK